MVTNRIVVNHRVPTSQYAYIDFSQHYDSIEEAMADHKRLLKLYENNDGLSTNEWAKVRNNMLVTGECDPNIQQEMNASQRYVINQMKLALRAHSPEDPIIT